MRTSARRCVQPDRPGDGDRPSSKAARRLRAPATHSGAEGRAPWTRRRRAERASGRAREHGSTGLRARPVHEKASHRICTRSLHAIPTAGAAVAGDVHAGLRRRDPPAQVRRRRRHRGPDGAGRGAVQSGRRPLRGGEGGADQAVRSATHAGARRGRPRYPRPGHVVPGSRAARPRAPSAVPGRAVRLRALHLRRAAGWRRAPLERRVRCPDRARRRLRRDRPAGALHDGVRDRRTAARRRADPHPGRLVPAVPQPLDRRPGVRAGRHALRQRRRWRELRVRRRRRYRPDQPHVSQPGRSAARRRSASLAGPPDRRRRAGRQRLDPARRPRHRAGGSGQPAPRDPPDRVRPAQPVPHRVPARHARAVDRRRRGDLVGGAEPDRRRERPGDRELRLAVLRGRQPALGVRRTTDLRLADQRRAAARHTGDAGRRRTSPTRTARRPAPT